MVQLKRLRGPDRERGAAMVMTALAAVVMLAFAAFGVDYTNLVQDRRQVQGAADAAALAAAQDLPNATKARNTAAEYAALNVGMSSFGSGSTCGGSTCYAAGEYTLELTTPYAAGTGGTNADHRMRVRICHELPGTFSRVIGVNDLTACGTATSAIAIPTPVNPSAGICALCALRPTGTGISSTGGGTLSVVNGNIHVNSDANNAVSLTGGGSISAEPAPPHEFRIHGGHSSTANSLQPTPVTGAPEVEDPLADFPVPTFTAPVHSNCNPPGGVLTPGIYTCKISNTRQLQPGAYVFTDKDAIKLSGSSSVTVLPTTDPAYVESPVHGDGVMLYMTCPSYLTTAANSPTPTAHCAPDSSNGASIDLSGSSAVLLRPPTKGPFQGMSLFVDRNNTNEQKLTGSSTGEFVGTIYAKTGTLSMTGPSGFIYRSAVIVGDIKKTGDSNFSVVYDASVNPPIIAPPSAGPPDVSLTG
jgi:Flp pilus assembly protein TadG